VSDKINISITKVAKSRLAEIDFNNLPFGKTFSDHMFIADYSDGEWKDFKIVPFGEIGISPAMSSLHYGQAFFEGIKAYKHANGNVSIFRPDKNAERFNLSAQRLCMPELPVDIFLQSVEANSSEDAYELITDRLKSANDYLDDYDDVDVQEI
jgi:branched-chain amino acid aminotransferase